MSAAGAGDASAVTGMEPLGRSGLGPLSPSNPKTSFDPEKCSAYFKQCATHLHDIPIEPFLQACEEIKKIIGASVDSIARQTKFGASAGWRQLTHVRSHPLPL